MVYLSLFILCHIIGDFYLQTWKIAKCKSSSIDVLCDGCIKCTDKKGKKFRISTLTIHIGLYCIPFLISFFILEWYYALLFVGIIFISHWIIDLISCVCKNLTKKTLVFLIDQVAHIIVISILWLIFDYRKTIILEYESVIIMAIIVAFLITPAMVVINQLFYDIFGETDLSDKKQFDVGMMIGVFERIIVLVLVLFNAITAIAIIITVKTWARTDDIKKGFANKYLIGTLVSISIALVGAYIWTQLVK